MRPGGRNCSPAGPMGNPLILSGEPGLPKGLAADIGGLTMGGGGLPVFPASFAIWLRIFWTFSGGKSGEQMPCFFNLCTLKKYLLQNSLQQISQKASALITPICRSFSGVNGPLGVGPEPPIELGALTLGTFGMLGMRGRLTPPSLRPSLASLRRASKLGRPPNIRGLKPM